MKSLSNISSVEVKVSFRNDVEIINRWEEGVEKSQGNIDFRVYGEGDVNLEGSIIGRLGVVLGYCNIDKNLERVYDYMVPLFGQDMDPEFQHHFVKVVKEEDPLESIIQYLQIKGETQEEKQNTFYDLVEVVKGFDEDMGRKAFFQEILLYRIGDNNQGYILSISLYEVIKNLFIIEGN